LNLFHVNIRSLNSNCACLYQYLQLLTVCFDVIILSEIWTTNIDFYVNSLLNYTLFYDIPQNSKVGGVGIFVSNDVKHEEVGDYKLASTACNMIEDEFQDDQTCFIAVDDSNLITKCIANALFLCGSRALCIISSNHWQVQIMGNIKCGFIL